MKCMLNYILRYDLHKTVECLMFYTENGVLITCQNILGNWFVNCLNGGKSNATCTSILISNRRLWT